jgi:hypothetical protein
VIQSEVPLSGVDAVFNRGISAYIINDIIRAKSEVIYGLRREKLGFDRKGSFLNRNELTFERHCFMKQFMCLTFRIILYT